jgi:hypothetical protein
VLVGTWLGYLVAGDEEGFVIEVFDLEVGADECFFEGYALTDVEVGSLTNEPIVWFDCDTKHHVTRVDARLIVSGRFTYWTPKPVSSILWPWGMPFSRATSKSFSMMVMRSPLHF